MARDSGGYYIIKIFPGLASVILSIVFVRTQGVSSYGAFAVAVAAASVASLIGSGWMRSSVLRFSGTRGPSGVVPVVARALTYVGTGVACSAVCGTLLSLDVPTALSAGVVGSVSAWMTIRQTVLMVRLDVKGQVWRELSRGISTVALPLIALWLWPEMVFLSLLALAFSCWPYLWIPEHEGEISVDYSVLTDSRKWIAWLKYGIPWSLAVGIGALLSFSDRFAIQVVLGPEAAGQYSSVVDTLGKVAGFVLFPLVQACVPRLMRNVHAGDERGARDVWRLTLRVVCGLGTVLALLLALIGPLLVHALLGIVVDRGVCFLIALISVAWPVVYVMQLRLEVTRRTSLTALLYLIVTACVVYLETLLASQFGLMGASGALVMGLGVIACACWLFTLKMEWSDSDRLPRRSRQ